MANKPKLDLITALAPDAVLIGIDGVNYEIRNIEGMGIREQAEFVRMGRRYEELTGLEDMSDEDLETADELITKFVDLVLDAPKEVKAKLFYNHRVAIIGVFTEASGVKINQEPTQDQESQETVTEQKQPQA